MAGELQPSKDASTGTDFAKFASKVSSSPTAFASSHFEINGSILLAISSEFTTR